MTDKSLIECVPNFSEGRDQAVIDAISAEIRSVDGVRLLNVEPGKATNRTVVTFVGEPEPVVNAAFLAIRKAADLIDMKSHKGEHPRMGATDVCPFIPVSNISMEETAKYAHQLGKRVGEELGIPVFMYENAATEGKRKNLATIRSGEYEGMADKIKKPEWRPDYGPAELHANAGVTAIGARDFLVAYNVNLNTTSTRRANSVAFDVREKGRVKREGGKLTGKVIRDNEGNPVREKGACKGVKAIGWYIEEYGVAQISMNITELNETPIHVAFEECRKSATRRGLRVTGSELVGLVPKKVLIDAGKYYLTQQMRSHGIPEREIIHIAVKSMGLDELGPFNPDEKVIEYMLESSGGKALRHESVKSFSDLVSVETPTPGGGSVSAAVGALGAALGTMVANLSAHKRGWDSKWEYYSEWAEKGETGKARLLELIDKDTEAFNGILKAFRMPRGTDKEQAVRRGAIRDATKNAIEVPLQIMRESAACVDLMEKMIEEGNPSSITDAAVGAECILTAVRGGRMNVLINTRDLDDPEYVKQVTAESNNILNETQNRVNRIREAMEEKL